MAQHIRDEFFQIPIVTRVYSSACVLTTLAVQLNIVSPLLLLYHPQLVLKGEVSSVAMVTITNRYHGDGQNFNLFSCFRYGDYSRVLHSLDSLGLDFSSI
jgi:Derlin-2/3